MTSPALKICGITRREDAEAAAGAGALYLGAIFAPESPRSVSADEALALFADLSPSRVGVFVNASAEDVVRTATAADLDVIQLHGEEEVALVEQIRSAGVWSVWKAVPVRTARDLQDAVGRYGGVVDGILVDTWSPSSRGGTGESFDWAAVARARDGVPAHLTFVIAGGLRAENVARAVALLRPDAVDISSGVELSAGVKDARAIDALVLALRGGIA
jgi:phosphoribosylanthranilate isomerase